jgi:hypothetical protein
MILYTEKLIHMKSGGTFRVVLFIVINVCPYERLFLRIPDHDLISTVIEADRVTDRHIVSTSDR